MVSVVPWGEIRVDVAPLSELGPAELQTWRRLQAAVPDLRGPCFHPEYFRAVAESKRDVHVAILEHGSQIAGFFPFERHGRRQGRPAGFPLTDFQGVVAEPSLEINPPALLRACGLDVWDFDHLLCSQGAWFPYHTRVAISPFMDLSQGYEAYLAARRRAGSTRLSQLQRKRRKVEREVGPLRFDGACSDGGVLHRVIELKSSQCRRTGTLDFFGQLPWARALVQRIAETDEPGFRGALSALFVGDELVAAHMGVISDPVMHWWFPVHEPGGAFAKYSVGGILLLEVARHAAQSGLTVLELGKGDDDYKRSFSSGARLLASGTAQVPSLTAVRRRVQIASRLWLRYSPALGPLRTGYRWLKTVRR